MSYHAISTTPRRLPRPLLHRGLGLVTSAVHLPMFQTVVRVPSIWLPAALLFLWLIARYYVPLLAPALAARDSWTVALVSVLLVASSLLAHVLAHLGMCRLLQQRRPAQIVVYPFGDAAQTWLFPMPSAQAGLIAAAGPCLNLLLGGAAYLIWTLSTQPVIELTALLLVLVNIGLAVLNLAPGFPMDGGHLTRAIVSGVLRSPDQGTPLAGALGWSQVLGLVLWGGYLLIQDVRYSGVTGTVTLSVGMLLAGALRNQPAWLPRGLSPRPPRAGIARWSLAVGLLLGLLSIAGSLVPTVHGVRTPGAAVPIEPMVWVPPSHRHPARGSFLLTTVVDQTPIVAGQWLAAHLNPAVDLVAAERIIPREVTAQALTHRNYQLLISSEATARQVAMRHAGEAANEIPVAIHPAKIIGGPSAGLMFALTVYNLLTPGDVTGGWRIAGTGTIDDEGRVGPVVGLPQKVAAAEAAQVDYFLVPRVNYEATAAVARRVQVIPVGSFEEAIDVLQRLPTRGDD